LIKGNFTRIQLAYALFLMFVVLCTVIVSYVSSTQRLEKEVVESNLNMLDQINKRMESMLSSIDSSVIHFLQNKDAQYFYTKARSQEAAYLMQINNVQKQISLLRNSNKNIASIHMYAKRNNTVLSDEFHDTLENKPALSGLLKNAEHPAYYLWTSDPPEQDNLATQHHITLIRHFPVAEKPENRTGMIAVHIREQSMSSMFADLRFNKSGNVFVINQDGIVVSHTDESKIGQSVAVVLGDTPQWPQKNSGYFHKKSGNTSEWIFYADSLYTGWKLVYIVDQEQMSALFFTVRNLLIALAAGMILLSIASVVFLNRTWFYPVELFVRRIEQLTDKQADHTVRSGAIRISTGLDSLEGRIRSMMTSYSDAERQLHENKPMLKLQILFDIFVGHRLRYEGAKAYFDHIGMSIYPANFLVMTVELDNRMTHEHVNDINLYLYAISNVAEELINVDERPLRGAAVQINEYQVAILISFKTAEPSENEGLAYDFAHHLQETVSTTFKQTISIGVGSHYENFSDIRLSYQESQQLVHYKMITGRNTIITRSQMPDDPNGLMQLYELAEILLEAVKQADRDKAMQASDAMFAIVSDNKLNHQGIVQFSLQLIYRTGIASGDQSIEAYLKERYRQLEKSLEQCETIGEIKQRFAEIVDLMFDKLLEKRVIKKRTWNTIEEVILYLDTHYNNPNISLNYLADKFQLSPGYLSKSFKDFTTINFMDYLTQIRMRAAQRLLKESSQSISDIAEQVGYTNVTSFMRSFKKNHGLTPSEYRQIER